MKIELAWNHTLKDAEAIEKSYLHAKTILKDFISVNHLPALGSLELIDEIIVFNKHSDFKKILISTLSMNKEDIQPTCVGTIWKKTLYLMTKSYYFDHYASGIETFGYEKLIAHELAHAYHIHLLDGIEEKMGPVWFYEGFAIFASGQFASKIEKVSNQHLERILFSEDRMFYQLYGALFHELVVHEDLMSLVSDAANPHFSQSIYDLLTEKTSLFYETPGQNKIESFFHESLKRDYILLFTGNQYEQENDSTSQILKNAFYLAGMHVGIYHYRNQLLRYPFLFDEGIEFIKQLRKNSMIRNLYLFGEGSGGHFALYLLEKASQYLSGGILVSPYVSTQEGIKENHTIQNLLGKEPSKLELKKLSLENEVHQGLPKIYLCHWMDDAITSPRHSILLLDQLNRFSILSHAHFYPKGNQGKYQSIQTNQTNSQNWFTEAISFLDK
ncbi:MAG: hypothetical protein AB7U79_09100 [Candidatus Izemoplasmatales bacterium]